MGSSKLARWFISAELIALRELIELTQKGLGDALGFSSRTITNWEVGVSVPRRSIVKDICEMACAQQSRTDFLLFVVDNYQREGLVANLHSRNVRIIERVERTYGYLFKYEPEYVPGPFQLADYHNGVLPLEGPRSEHADALKRKIERGRVLEERIDNPRVELLIGYNALRHLRAMTHWDRQIERLIRASERPNWEVRVIDGLHNGARGNFDLYRAARYPHAGPDHVYTESHDQSRYIEDALTLDWYDQLRIEIWDLGKPIKEIFSGGIQLLA